MFNTIEINLNNSTKTDHLLEDDHLIAIFGCIADIQYSDSDDSTMNGSTRLYRNSLNQIKKAIQIWRSYEQENNARIEFILQLGDLIDGKSKNTAKGSLGSMHTVLDCLDEMQSNVFHVYGNHEFYNFYRSEIIHLPLNTAKMLNPNLK